MVSNMKKYLFGLLVLIAVSFSFSLMLTSSSEAGECARSGTSITIDSSASGDGKIVNGDDGAGHSQMNCVEEPLFYKITFYKVLLCTTDPYVSNDDPVFTGCTGTIFETTSTSGKSISIEPGEKVDLIDAGLELPIGTYGYAALIVDNHIGIKHTETYIDKDNIPDAQTMIGKTGSGSTCWTVADGATTYTNTSAATHTSGLHASGLAFTAPDNGTRSTLTLDCGSATDGTYGFAWEIIDSIDDTCDASGDCDTTFNAFTNYDSADDLGVGGLAASTLLQSDGTTMGTNRGNSVKIGYFLNFTNPLNVTEDVISLDMQFSTKASVSVDHSKDGTDVYASKVGADPFGVKFVLGTR